MVDGSRCGRRCPSRSTGPKAEGFLDGGFAVRVGNAELADDDLGVDALLVDVAEHFQDLADRTARRRRPRGDLARRTISPGSAARRLSGRECTSVRKPRRKAARSRAESVHVEAADNRGVAALEHADDAALEPSSGVPLDAREHAIAVHRLLHVPGRHVDVRRIAVGFVGNDEAKTGRMHLQAPNDEVHFFGEANAVAFRLDQLAGC